MAKTIVLLGKTGTGKSATANILCGDDFFKSKRSSGSVTKVLQKKTFRYGNDDTEFCVVDSPGIFDCQEDDHNLTSSLFKLLEQQDITINLFLIVFSLQQRFTKADIETFKTFDEAFGKIWSDFGGIVFTHADMFNGRNEIHSYIREYSDFYQIIQCRFGERFITIDNNRKDELNRKQILAFITDCMQKSQVSYTHKILSHKKITRPSEERPEDEKIDQYRKDHKQLKTDLKMEERKSKIALEEKKEQLVAFKTEGSETCQLASIVTDTTLQQLSAEKSCTCENCENNPTFKCKDCKKNLCKECNILHQFHDDTVSHNVKQIKDEKKRKKSTQCTLCTEVLPFTCSCPKCGPICRRCEMFHWYAFPTHKTPETTFERATTNDYNMYAAMCEKFMKCGRRQQFTCVDCKKCYCRKCVKKFVHEDFHLVLDTDGLSLLPNKFGSKIAINQLVKCVIKIADDNTFFKMFFPYGLIYRPGSKEKSSTSKSHFHVISSTALFHQDDIVSIGDTAVKHKAIAKKFSKDEKMLFAFENVSRKPSSKEVEIYYKNLLSNLKIHWMIELQTKLRKMHIYLKESAIVMLLVKTLFITEIQKILKEDFFTDELECSLVSEEDVTKFIVVRDNDTDNFAL